MRRFGSIGLAMLLAIMVLLTGGPVSPALAESPSDVTAALERGDVYISPNAIAHGVATRADTTRLQQVVDRAARAGVDEKIAIISSYPSKYDSAQAATVALRQKLGFEGILVVVTPQAIGISSAVLTRRDIELIDRRATTSARCNANQPVGCALLAAEAAVPAYQNEMAILRVADTLKGQSVVITGGAQAQHLAGPGAGRQLDTVVRQAQAKGVTEKFLVMAKYPEGYSNPTDAAAALVKRIDLSGVLILVAPDGLGIGSDLMGSSDRNAIQAQAGTCAPAQRVPCAARAGQAAIPLYTSARAHQNLIDTIITIVVLVILAAIIALVIWLVLRQRRKTREHLADLRTAAGNTLELSDRAIEAIEGKAPLPKQIAKQYDAALALRARAREELDKAKTAAQLSQANEDAAHAALAFQGLLKALDLPVGPGNPLLEDRPRRCFYCARTNRPPYSTRTIDDGKGTSMTVDVCADDAKQLEEGKKPKVTTVQVGRRSVPWWAVPNDPYYYRYGGPGWQYWLPYATGVNVDQWYGGAWTGSYTQPPTKQDWGSAGGGDRDTTADVSAGHLSGTASWGDGGSSSGGDW